MDRIRLDYSDVLAESVGAEHGVTEAELAALAGPSREALRSLRARREQDLRWLDLPHRREGLERVLEYAAAVRGRFENVVVLGIGGSALGNRALHTALNGPFHDLAPPEGTPRLFVLDNIDPELIGGFLDTIDPTKCLFNVISKSGSTAETMSQFLVFRQGLVERLGEEGHREHVVVTTDAEGGVLRGVVRSAGYASFEVPEGVGGRFSVLSPVGLLSSALVGIDVEGLLEGAAFMDAACAEEDLLANPALLYAAVQWLMQSAKGKNVAVTFAYGERLAHLADWYAQLLGESLGKRLARDGREVFRGPTPVRAVGVTDQHSQVQLYVEGPHDKWFTLLAVDGPGRDVPIPAQDLPGAGEALAHLGGRSLGELFEAEREGTRIALVEARRPTMTLAFPVLDAHAVGQYLFLMELAVAVMGEHYGVDAFDQPGVEAGKLAAQALMGHPDHEARRAAIEGAARRRRRTV